MSIKNSGNDKLDSLKHISQIHRSQLDERRKYEWKIFLASISFYVLTVAAIYKDKIELQGNYISLCVIYFVFLAQAIVTIFFLARVHWANYKNKSIAEKAEQEIATLIKYALDKKSNSFWARCDKHFKNRDYLILFFQALMILIFAATSCILITLKL